MKNRIMVEEQLGEEMRPSIRRRQKSFARLGTNGKPPPKQESDEFVAGNQLRKKMQEFALREMERKRSRLGQISLQQEKALELLLNSTVERISDPLITWMRQCYAKGDLELALALEFDFR